MKHRKNGKEGSIYSTPLATILYNFRFICILFL